ncbi:MAG: DUF167 domain-containing protein [Chloroflexota bacterium]|jgi:uncharacterized protein YggU (UPF0235/DUF167 family)|nr:DUF167 domain-containing protein [Dehalococcoidia bacterium]MDW8045833.1 DUF167 domain-containing protein [Chloroflexota bacterium]
MARITVAVTPRASRARIEWDGELLRAWVTAPPAEGAANAALIALVAESLGVSRRAVRIASGASARRKLLEVDLEPGELSRRLEALRR